MRVGTVAFMPPEIHGATDTAYEGGPLDVWGLGCICYMMTTATFPFGFDGRHGGSSAIQVLRRIQLGAEAIEFRSSHFAPHVSLSESLIALLKAVFVVSPPERLDLDRIMGCEWVQAGYLRCTWVRTHALLHTRCSSCCLRPISSWGHSADTGCLYT